MKLLPPIESQDTMLSALSYPLGFFVSPFLLFSKKKEDSFVRFHAIQGLIVNIVVTVIILIGLGFLFLMAKTSPTATQIATYDPDPHNSGYMNNGCAFMFVWGGYFLLVFMLFLAEILCASRVWTGEDLRLPFISSFIEQKYFADIVAIEREAEKNGGNIITPVKTSSIDDLPTVRHDIPFIKTTPKPSPVEPTPQIQISQPQIQVQQPSYLQNNGQSYSQSNNTQPNNISINQTPVIDDPIAYAQQQQLAYNQRQNQQNTVINNGFSNNSQVNQQRYSYNNSSFTNVQERTRASYNEQGNYRQPISNRSSSNNTYADGSSKKIQL